MDRVVDQPGGVPLERFLPLLQRRAAPLSAPFSMFLDGVPAGLREGRTTSDYLGVILVMANNLIADYSRMARETFPFGNQTGVRNQARGFVRSLYRPAENRLLRYLEQRPISEQDLLAYVGSLRPLAGLRPAE
jgi:hypothetical protein